MLCMHMLLISLVPTLGAELPNPESNMPALLNPVQDPFTCMYAHVA